MPNRIIREGILSSEAVARLTWPEEVFLRRVMSIVDDYGRHEAGPQLLRSKCYPLQTDDVTVADIQQWLEGCERATVLICYQANGKRYLSVNKFQQQQRSASKCPPPPASAINCYQTPADDGIREQAPTDAHLVVSVSGGVSEGVVVSGGVENPPGAYAPAPPKGDALPDIGKPMSVPDMGNPIAAPAVASEPAEAPAAPSPLAAPVATPVAPPADPAGPVQRVSVFAAGAAKAKRSAREFDQPSWVPAAAWAEWLDYREEKAGGHTQWDFTVGEMRDVIRTLEKAMAIKGTTAAEELEDTRRAGLRKPNYFNGPDPTPTPPTLPTIAPAPPPLAPRVDPVLPVRPNRRNPAMHRPSDVTVPVWEQWTEFRRRNKAPVTELVLTEIRAEAAAAGLTLDAYLTKWLANGTKGFQAGYIRPAGQGGGFQLINKQAAVEARNADVTDAYIKERFGDGNE